MTGGLTFEGSIDVEDRAREILESTTLSKQESDIIAVLEEIDHYDPASIAEAIGTSRGTIDVALSRIRDKRAEAETTLEVTARVSPGRRS